MLTNASLWDSLVFDGIDDVAVEAVTAAFGTVEVAARGRAAGAPCPDCGRFSDRVHDRYHRRLKDLPLAEQGFAIRLTVRRFICGAGDCPRRTFAEPFSRLAAPYARFTSRLNHVLERVGSRWPGGQAPGWPPSWEPPPATSLQPQPETDINLRTAHLGGSQPRTPKQRGSPLHFGGTGWGWVTVRPVHRQGRVAQSSRAANTPAGAPECAPADFSRTGLRRIRRINEQH
ncbi:transposase family protein [Streptomyces sp. NPDC047860]|uniref:transposase family protein n=1 Tax=Streptomyces sp. NPDC047860 TaxID=3155743 RepID=UPI0033C42B3E